MGLESNFEAKVFKSGGTYYTEIDGTMSFGSPSASQVINHAINALSALNGGVVTLDRDTFSTTESIELKSDVMLRGQGNATRISYSGTGWAIHNPNKATASVSGVGIRDMRVLAASGNGIDFESVEQSRIDGKVEIYGNTGAGGITANSVGLHLGQSAGSESSWWNVIDVVLIHNFHTNVKADANTNRCYLRVQRSRGAGDYGVNIDASDGLILDLMDVQDGDIAYVRINGHEVHGYIYLEGSTNPSTAGLFIDSSASEYDLFVEIYDVGGGTGISDSADNGQIHFRNNTIGERFVMSYSFDVAANQTDKMVAEIPANFLRRANLTIESIAIRIENAPGAGETVTGKADGGGTAITATISGASDVEATDSTSQAYAVNSNPLKVYYSSSSSAATGRGTITLNAYYNA